MRRRDIVRMWSQIVHQIGKEKYTSEEWQESYERFWSCMTTSPDPFIHIENVDQLLNTWAARSEQRYPTKRIKRKNRVKAKRVHRNKNDHGEPIDQSVTNSSLMSQHLKESKFNKNKKPASKALSVVSTEDETNTSETGSVTNQVLCPSTNFSICSELNKMKSNGKNYAWESKDNRKSKTKKCEQTNRSLINNMQYKQSELLENASCKKQVNLEQLCKQKKRDEKNIKKEMNNLKKINTEFRNAEDVEFMKNIQTKEILVIANHKDGKQYSKVDDDGIKTQASHHASQNSLKDISSAQTAQEGRKYIKKSKCSNNRKNISFDSVDLKQWGSDQFEQGQQEIGIQNLHQEKVVLKEHGQRTKKLHPVSKISRKMNNQPTNAVKGKVSAMRDTKIENQSNGNSLNTARKIRNPIEGVQRRWTRSQSAGKMGKLQIRNIIHQQPNVKLRRLKLASKTNPIIRDMPSIDMPPAIIPDSISDAIHSSDDKRKSNTPLTEFQSCAESLKRSEETCGPREPDEPDFPASSQLQYVDVVDQLYLTTPPLLADNSNTKTQPSDVREIDRCLQNSNNEALRNIDNHVSDQRILDYLPKELSKTVLEPEALRNNEYKDDDVLSVTTSWNGDDDANYYPTSENQNVLSIHTENEEPQSTCERSEFCVKPRHILPATNATKEMSSIPSVLDIQKSVLLRFDTNDQKSEIDKISNEQSKQPTLLKHSKIHESKCNYKRKRNIYRNTYDDADPGYSGSDECEQHDLNAENDQPQQQVELKKYGHRKISRKMINQPTKAVKDKVSEMQEPIHTLLNRKENLIHRWKRAQCSDKIHQPQIEDQTTNVKLNLSLKLACKLNYITSNASSNDMSPASIADTKSDSCLIQSSDDKHKDSVRLTECRRIADSLMPSEETCSISQKQTCFNDADFHNSCQLEDVDVVDHCSTSPLENMFLSGLLKDDSNTDTRPSGGEINPCLQNANNETLRDIDHHKTDQRILEDIPKKFGEMGLELETLRNEDHEDNDDNYKDDVLSVNTSWDGEDEQVGIENDNGTTLNQHADQIQNAIVIQQKNQEKPMCDKKDEYVKAHPVLPAREKTRALFMSKRCVMQKSALRGNPPSGIPGRTEPIETNFQQQQDNLQGPEYPLNNQEIEHQSTMAANSNIIHTGTRELGVVAIRASSPSSNVYKNMSNLFGIKCWRFLDGKCNEISCYHILRNPRGVQHYLNQMETDKLCDIYSTVLRHGILFRKYFMAFGEIYGNRGMISHLMKMVEDCSLYMAYSAPIITNMYHLFLRFNVSPQLAVAHFMKYLWVPYIGKLYPSLTKSLLKILATADWYNYTSNLKNLFCNQEFLVPVDFMIYIANDAVTTKNEELILKVWDLASHCPIDGNNCTLISVMEMLKNYNTQK